MFPQNSTAYGSCPEWFDEYFNTVLCNSNMPTWDKSARTFWCNSLEVVNLSAMHSGK